jgi:hypothetical protein
MTDLQEFLSDDDAVIATLRESLFGASVRFNCFCEACGSEVADAEADADWTGGNGNIECNDCGPGTRIASGLIFAGVI